MRDLVTGERLFAAFLAAVGLLAVIQGLGYGMIRDDGIVGPGFVPVIVGALLAFCGAGIVVGSLRHREPAAHGLAGAFREQVEDIEEQARAEAEATGVAAAAPDKEGSERSAALVFAGIGLVILATPWLGLVPSLGLLTFGILWGIEKVGLLRAAAVAAGMSLTVWLVFDRFLSVPLPMGIFGPS